MERRRAPEAAARVVVAVAAGTAAGNRNLRRTRHFRPRGTSSSRPTTVASAENDIEN